MQLIGVQLETDDEEPTKSSILKKTSDIGMY